MSHIAVELTTTPAATRKRIRELLLACPAIIMSESQPVIAPESPPTLWFQPLAKVLWIWTDGIFDRVSDGRQEFVISEEEPDGSALPWFDPSDSSWSTWDPGAGAWVAINGSPAVAGADGASAYESYLATTPDVPPLSEAEWAASREDAVAPVVLRTAAEGPPTAPGLAVGQMCRVGPWAEPFTPPRTSPYDWYIASTATTWQQVYTPGDGGASGVVIVSETPPASPTGGLQWYDPSDGTTSIFEPTSAVWVSYSALALSPGGVPFLGVVLTLSDGTPLTLLGGEFLTP